MRSLIKIAILLAFLNAVEPALAQLVIIEGYVKTADGVPVKDVNISDLEATDESGHFKLASDVFFKNVNNLVFDKPGFIPKVVVLDAENTKLAVTLEPEKESGMWDIPDCSFTKTRSNRIVGKYLALIVPKTMKYKSGKDTVNRYYSIGFKKNKETYWLRGGFGDSYGGPSPSGDTLLGLQSYSYRRTSAGIDWRGQTKEGKYWRYFGAVFDTYYYETASKEAADIFDKILDGVCHQPIDSCVRF